jgi:hypothetical protein
MSRQTELYKKVAADYDSMALLVNDQRLRNMFVGFAQQWREAALAADSVGAPNQLKQMEETDYRTFRSRKRIVPGGLLDIVTPEAQCAPHYQSRTDNNGCPPVPIVESFGAGVSFIRGVCREFACHSRRPEELRDGVAGKSVALEATRIADICSRAFRASVRPISDAALRSDTVSITNNDQTQIGLTCENAISVAKVIKRITARRGPRSLLWGSHG